jgi:hypothetical protein
MNLPDTPVAGEGFLDTHFFTVRNQEKSSRRSLRHQARQLLDHSQFRWRSNA